MRFIIVLFCFIAYAQCNELIVKGDAVDRIFCCNQVQSRCTMACAGSDCSRTCSGLCGIFGTRCGPWTCSALNPGTCTAVPVPAQLLFLWLHLYPLLSPLLMLVEDNVIQ